MYLCSFLLQCHVLVFLWYSNNSRLHTSISIPQRKPIMKKKCKHTYYEEVLNNKQRQANQHASVMCSLRAIPRTTRWSERYTMITRTEPRMLITNDITFEVIIMKIIYIYLFRLPQLLPKDISQFIQMFTCHSFIHFTDYTSFIRK